MVDVFNGPYGTYTSVQIVIANAQTEIMLNIQSLATLLGVTITAGVVAAVASTGSHPDFNKIPAATRRAIGRELASLSAAVDAMPVA